MQTFIVNGYGVPEDIFRDENYRTYLLVAFNTMFSLAAHAPALIIPSGGPTNTVPPFLGTEAEAIATYLRHLMQRPEVTNQTKDWRIIPEQRALSTLENLLFAKEIAEANGATGPITIFCEHTRNHTITDLAQRIFGADANIHAIDFDRSKTRYIDPSITAEKEAASLEGARWVLEDPERLPQHHAFYEKKLAFFRQRQSEGVPHADAVVEWYTAGREALQQLLPDHPLLKK
jgi:hypothetical protein